MAKCVHAQLRGVALARREYHVCLAKFMKGKNTEELSIKEKKLTNVRADTED